MVVHVLERAASARCVTAVIVATDDERIAEAVTRAGGQAVMTPSSLPSGSDRVAWVMRSRSEPLVVNVQGDEPLLDPATIDAVVQGMCDAGAPVGTASAPLGDVEAQNPNRVKVVVDSSGRALYFSRAPIPHGGPYRLHVGLYAWRTEALLQFAAAPPSALERCERLEQLRLLERGVPIQVVPIGAAALSVDTPEDLERIRALVGDPPPSLSQGP